MSEDQTSAPGDVRDRYHDGDRHVSPRLTADNAEWLADRTHSVDTVVRIERIRRENPETYRELWNAFHDDVKAKVIRVVLLEQGTTTYDTLDGFIDRSKRRLKDHVYGLEDAGILIIGNGKPAAITFPDPAVELLAREVLELSELNCDKIR